MPDAAIDKKGLWRQKSGYLFDHTALAIVFRAKMLQAIRQERLTLPSSYPKAWVVDVKSVGTGEKALIYLGRYLYKGVIQEKDIVACENGQVQNNARCCIFVVDSTACFSEGFPAHS